MSIKALANLVCEASVRTSENVLTRELGRNLDDLKKGVLAFGPPPPAPSTTEASGSKDSHKKLGTFIRELSQFLQIDEEKSRRILSTYLAGDFRGTKDSLKKLVSEDRYRKPLLRDIWYFYRAERLYLLQVLKEVMSHARSTEHKHADIFATTFDKLRAGDVLKKSLFEQLKSVLNESPPNRETLGKYFSEDVVTSWSHVNLRELVEVLQLILLYYYNSDEDEEDAAADDFLELLRLFQSHNFGRKVSAHSAKTDVHSELIEAVGCLESFLLICLMDLPRMTSGSLGGVWTKSAEIDRIIAGLGNRPDHGPVMLSWMLAHYIIDEDFGRFRNLGERAVQLKVLQHMLRSLQNNVVTGNKAVASVVNSAAFAVVSVLVSAFEPSRMNLDEDVHALMCTLLKDRRIAATFWKLGFESGLGSVFESKLSQFPARITESIELCVALAEASPESADEVLHCLQSLSTFAEYVENVPTRDLIHKSGGNQFELCSARIIHSMQIPKGCRVSSDGRFYYFLVNNFDGIKYLLGECDQLIHQASLGASNLNKETIDDVTLITQLEEVLLRNGTTCLQTLGHHVSKSCFLLVEKCVRLPLPPVLLLANCLKNLSLLARQRPHSVWEKLSETGIFPYMTSGSGMHSTDDDVNPGIVGALLAQHECVRGVYPLTTSFLDLLLSCVTRDTVNHVRPSVIFIIQDIFPSYQQWRFEVAKEREIFGQKLLLVIRRVVLTNKDNPLQTLAIQTLMSPAPNQTLLTIAATGDRIIQSHYESQASMEGGVGVELSRCVHLSLDILNILLHKTGLDNLSSLKKVLCSPPQAARPHFLLTISHYLYHLQSCDLPLAAVKMMSTVATILPMSLLACLGSDAEAIRDILIHRLEAQTEDILLKIAIIKFFNSCVDSQPGLIQLLIGVKSNVQVVRSFGLTSQEVSENDVVDLVGDHGCLSAVLDLLNDMTEKSDRNEVQAYDLHVTLVEFVYSLWSNQRVVALSYLKRQPNFWTIVTKPLFETSETSKAKLIGCILSIIASEIYTYKGQVDASLVSVLEKFADEKSCHMSDWCMAKTLQQTEAVMDTEETLLEVTAREQDGDDVNESAFLLSSWKAFLVVLSRDQPIAVSPKTCQMVVASLIKAVRGQLSARIPDLRVTTALSETCLVLMQRWQTKCAEKMEPFILDQADLLAETSLVFENLNPRSRSAILGIASTALKFSSFMMDKEEEILSSWLSPVVDLIEKSLSFEVEQEVVDSNDSRQVLSLCLLQNLLSRFPSATFWQATLHERSVVQSLLSSLHHAVRARSRPDLARDCLGLLILIGRTETGCDALLGGSDLSQMLWLPLSMMQPATLKDIWAPVFLLSIQLASTLLRVGKQRALENSIATVSLLQEHLTSFLLSLRDVVHVQHLDLTLASASFVSNLMSYFKQWQLHHPSSLVHFYRVLCSLTHRCICLLIRPTFLNVIIGQQEKEKDLSQIDLNEDRRARRRMSSAEYLDGSLSEVVTSPETTSVQNRLLDIVGRNLSALLALSPDLLALVTDDIMDCDAFEQLLLVGFSTPSFEQDESLGLSYGTVIAVCNLCIRSMTRTTDRSPSPSKSGRSESGSMDRKRLILVLEKSLILVLAQGLLFLADQRIVARDKQLLRRELGAELGSITENMRRYIHRGTKSPQADAGKSPVSSRLSKSDESFMKFVTTIVQKAFK